MPCHVNFNCMEIKQGTLMCTHMHTNSFTHLLIHPLIHSLTHIHPRTLLEILDGK